MVMKIPDFKIFAKRKFMGYDTLPDDMRVITQSLHEFDLVEKV